MDPMTEKAFISFRISIMQWLPENRFRELMELFEKYSEVTDEVTFFTSETHPPLPLRTIEERTAILAERMPKVRDLGYRTGINVLATIGHRNENLPNSLSADYTRMTDLDGNIGLGSFCSNDENMQGYIKELYRLVTSASPDYIWIDDDVRLFGHIPVVAACFCDNCLRIFGEEFGISHTRESLRTAFNNGPREAKLHIRRKWLQHNRNTTARLLELIERTVHELKPGLPLGFMTGDRFFEGYDFHRWAEILSGPGKAEVLWRPGVGTYTDAVLDEIARKAHQIGRQTSMLPESVISIQSELESYTYERLKKSAHVTALEASSYIASGCTGTAFNVLSMYNEPLDEYEPLVARLKEVRPFLDLLAQNTGRVHPVGLYTGWVRDSFVARNIAGGDWFNGPDEVTSHATEILSIGIPAAYSPSMASVTALCGDSVTALKDEEILKILSSGVYMDAQALTRLNEMGYGNLTGFEVERAIDRDCMEQFATHPLNGNFAGQHRNCRQSFYHELAHVLKLCDEKAKILVSLVDYTYAEVAPCGMGIFENQLGGRICVAGYYPWVRLQNLSKSSQIKSVLRWLSKDTLPAYIESFHRINLWVRQPAADKHTIALTNAYLDSAKGLTLMLLTDEAELNIFHMNCVEAVVQASGTDGPYKRFVLPEVGPWEMLLGVTYPCATFSA